jgi:hypothetical protein
MLQKNSETVKESTTVSDLTGIAIESDGFSFPLVPHGHAMIFMSLLCFSTHQCSDYTPLIACVIETLLQHSRPEHLSHGLSQISSTPQASYLSLFVRLTLVLASADIC